MATIDEDLRRRFEADRLEGGEAPLADFLPPEDDPRRAATLEELVLIDLEFRWKRYVQTGETEAPPSVEDYVPAYPALGRPEVRARLERESAWLLHHHRAGSEHAGQRLGSYELRARLGAGAFATVWRAYDHALAREVALKIPRAGLGAAPKVLARVRHEAQSAARLSHPDIVSVYEVGEDDERPFFALELVDGPTLAERLQEGAFTPHEAARLVARIADAVGYAHDCGVIHRDIKPGNLLLGSDGRARLADFGLARLTAIETDLTPEGGVLGTPAYMAPEQARGDTAAIGPQTDVYGLGAVLYELLTGRRPFDAPSPAATVYAVAHEEPRRPSRLARGIPTDLETICLKAMAKEPDGRYATAQELAADLRRFLALQPIHARRRGALGRSVLWLRRNPTLATTILLAVLAVGAVAAVGLEQVLEERSRYRAERDRARDNLVRSLLGEAEALIEAGGADWAPAAPMARVEEAAPLLRGPEDLRVARDLVVRCATSPTPSIDRAAVWPAVGGRVRALAADPAGTAVAGATRAGGLWIRAARDGAVLRRTSLPSPGHCLLWAGPHDTLLVGCEDGWVRGLGTETLETVASADPRAGAVRALALHPGGDLLAVGCGEGAIVLLAWESATTSWTPQGRLPGHEGGTYTLAFTRDGAHLVSGGADRTTRLWDWRAGTVSAVGTESDPVRFVVCSPTGEGIATSTFEQLGFCLRSPPEFHPRVPRERRFHSGGVTALFFDERGRLVSGGSDGSLAIWSPHLERLAAGQTLLGGIVASCAWEGGVRIALAHEDGRLSHWRVTNTDTVRSFGTVQGAAFVPGTRRLVTDRRVTDFGAWEQPPSTPLHATPVVSLDEVDGRLRVGREPPGPSEPHRAEARLAGGVVMAAAKEDGAIEVRRQAGGARLATLRIEDARLSHPRFTSDARSLVALGSDGRLHTWDPASWTLRDTHALEMQRVRAMVVSPLEPLLAVVAAGGVVLLDVEHLGILARCFVEAGTAACFTATGDLLVGTERGAVWRWKAATLSREWQRVRTARDKHLDAAPAWLAPDESARPGGHAWWTWGVAVSPDGRWIGTSGHTGDVNLWRADTGEHLRTLRATGELAWTATFSPDSRTLVAGAGPAIDLFDVATGRVRRHLAGDGRLVSHLAWHPSGALLLACDQDGVTRIWDVGEGAQVGTLEAGGRSVRAVAFSPDGTRLAGVGRDGDTLVWSAEVADLVGGQAPRHVWPGHVVTARGVAYDPTGALLATGAEDGRVLLREAGSGRVLLSLRAGRSLRHLAFSGDGTLLAASGFNVPGTVWHLDRIRERLRAVGLGPSPRR